MGTAQRARGLAWKWYNAAVHPPVNPESWSSGRLAWLEITLPLSSLDSGSSSVLLQLEASGGRGQLSCVESSGKGLWTLGENWKTSTSRCLVLNGGHLTRKGESIAQGHPSLQTNLFRLIRETFEAFGNMPSSCLRRTVFSNVLKPCASTHTKEFLKVFIGEPLHRQGFQGPRLRRQDAQTCSLKCCHAALELTSFLGKLVHDLGTVERNCRHIKRMLFVFCLFLDQVSDVFICKLGSWLLSHYLRLILCFLWATFKSTSNEKYCLIFKCAALWQNPTVYGLKFIVRGI